MKKEILVDMVLCLIMCISCGKSTSESSTAELTVTESGQEVSEVENDEPSVASSSVKQIENTGNGSVSDVTTVEDKEQYSSTKDGKKPAASSDSAIAQTLEEDEFIIEEDDMPADENKPGTSAVKAPDESKTKKTDPSSKENGTAAPSVRQTDYTDNLVLPEDTNF